ncbi:MAG: YqaE/Pmp3 family membrane protein [Rubrobacter sp.]|nr:YqaE/Pmp3 family membrane protein [Rubrobacter sp.]
MASSPGGSGIWLEPLLLAVSEGQDPISGLSGPGPFDQFDNNTLLMLLGYLPGVIHAVWLRHEPRSLPPLYIRYYTLKP